MLLCPKPYVLGSLTVSFKSSHSQRLYTDIQYIQIVFVLKMFLMNCQYALNVQIQNSFFLHAVLSVMGNLEKCMLHAHCFWPLEATWRHKGFTWLCFILNRLCSATDATLSLEKVPSTFSLFEHYVDSPGKSNQNSLKHVAGKNLWISSLQKIMFWQYSGKFRKLKTESILEV